jgi:hypothetical protein
MIPLESLELLQDWFNGSAGKWRVIALTSST